LFTDANGYCTILAENDCGSVSKIVSLVSISPIDISIIHPEVFCQGQEVELIVVTEGAPFIWSSGDTSRSILVKDSGIYTVFVADENCKVQESIYLTFDDCKSYCNPLISNVITPNADGLNDVFSVGLDCSVTNYNLSILNRWGQEIFFATSVIYSWDGYIGGVAAAEGVYFYVLKFEDSFKKNHFYKGTFSLLK
jgi:gliding motility-associated-like protein